MGRGIRNMTTKVNRRTKNIRTIVYAEAKRIESDARKRAPRSYPRSSLGTFLPGGGGLRRSIRTEVIEAAGVYTIRLTADKPYARAVERGSGRHLAPGARRLQKTKYPLLAGGYIQILPIRAKVLRFVGRTGDTVFATGVKHPGQKAQPYMNPAIRAGRSRIRRAMARGGLA